MKTPLKKPSRLARCRGNLTARETRALLLNFEKGDCMKTKSHAVQELDGLRSNFDPTAFLLAFCQSADTPSSLAAYLQVKYGEIDQYVEKFVNPLDFLDEETYFLAKQSYSLLRKYPFPGREENCDSVARVSFRKCEDKCGQTNQIFERLVGQLHANPAFDAVLFSAQNKISRLLGSLDVAKWLDNCRFGPGAVVGVPGTSDYRKLSENPSCTRDLMLLARAFLMEYPAWLRALHYDRNAHWWFTVVEGGKYATVPKDAKTHRNIETQPLINAFMQLGLGSLIRSNLKKVGVDLDDQRVNQNLAEQGSMSGFWATLDLSNASDTIARELVRYLIPSDWFHAMDICRTHSVTGVSDKNEAIPLNRFCSMGNGFAFELESLIFWAISKSTCEAVGYAGRIAVYGDDIIVPSYTYDDVCINLELAGFEVNRRKSFAKGPFRESCGADFWNGTDVRPYFLKEVPTNVASIVAAANGIRRCRLYSPAEGMFFSRMVFRRCWLQLLRYIPVSVMRRIEFGFTRENDVLFHNRERRGRRLLFIQKKDYLLNWFPALATALYRSGRKNGTSINNTLLYRLAHLESKIEPSKGLIFDYRREHGDWRLRKAAISQREKSLTMFW